MNKKKLFPILLVFMSVASVVYMADSRQTNDRIYQQYVESARKAAEERILVDAEQNYNLALEKKPSIDLSIEIGNMYLNLEEYDSAYYWYDRHIKDKYPEEAEGYAFGMLAAIKREQVAQAFTIYDNMKKRDLESDKAEELYDQIRYEFHLSNSFSDVGAFANNSGYAAVKSEDKWGYTNTAGEDVIRPQFEKAGMMGELAPVVNDEHEPIFIDPEGNRKVNATVFEENNPEFGKITEFISEDDGYVLASNGNEMAFFSLETGEKICGDYQEATSISNGVFAATKNGIDWAILDAEGKELTGYQFQSVLADKKNYICRNNSIIVREMNMYFLINKDTGKPVTDARYKEAKAFADQTLAAVNKNGKWLFVDENGKEYDLGDYQEAKSFSNHLAPVRKGELWGYIDESGKMVIEPQFEDADPISTLGVGFVRIDEKWKLLTLYSQNHDS